MQQQQTRVLVFQDEGDIWQVFFPRLSPLWVLVSLSVVVALNVILTLVCLRLYHDKRVTLSNADDLLARLTRAELQLTGTGLSPVPIPQAKPVETAPSPVVSPTPTPVPSGGSLSDKFFALVTGSATIAETTASDSPFEFIIGDEGDARRLRFGVRTKQAMTNPVVGRICGVFVTDDTVTLLPNAKVSDASWMSQPGASFAEGSQCDPFKVQNAKWYTLSFNGPLKKGVIQVFHENGSLLHSVLLPKAPTPGFGRVTPRKSMTEPAAPPAEGGAPQESPEDNPESESEVREGPERGD